MNDEINDIILESYTKIDESFVAKAKGASAYLKQGVSNVLGGSFFTGEQMSAQDARCIAIAKHHLSEIEALVKQVNKEYSTEIQKAPNKIELQQYLQQGVLQIFKKEFDIKVDPRILKDDIKDESKTKTETKNMLEVELKEVRGIVDTFTKYPPVSEKDRKDFVEAKKRKRFLESELIKYKK